MAWTTGVSTLGRYFGLSWSVLVCLGLFWSVLGCFGLIVSCSSGSTPAGAGCPSGQASFAGVCASLCTSNADCTDTEVCGTSGICEAASEAANIPRITGVNGNGSADGAAGHTANHLADGIVLTGTNLQHTSTGFAAVLLDPSGNETDLTSLVASSSEAELHLRVPTTLVSGDSYTIRVSNQFGSDQTTVLVLQGEPGSNGAAGLPGSCTSANCDQALPGMSSLAAIELRAVNGAAGVDADVAVTTGLATDPFVRRTAGSTGGQGFAVVFLKRTPADKAHTLSNEIADVALRATEFQSYQTLTTQLADAAVTSETVLALASYGDVLQAGLGDATARTALFDELARFGAPAELYQLTSTDAFILVGYKDIGEGNGIFVRSSTTRDVENSGAPDDGRVAETLVWLMDRHLLGTQTAQLRRTSMLTAIQLAVNGNATVTGTSTLTGTVNAPGGIVATGATLNGTVSVPTGGTLALADNGSLTVGSTVGSVHLGSGSINAGSGTFSGNVSGVNGTLSGTLGVTGHATLATVGGLQVGGTADVVDLGADMLKSGTLEVGGGVGDTGLTVDGTGLVETDNGFVGLFAELGTTSAPGRIDFKNQASDDFDVRLTLSSDTNLNLEGGSLTVTDSGVTGTTLFATNGVITSGFAGGPGAGLPSVFQLVSYNGNGSGDPVRMWLSNDGTCAQGPAQGVVFASGGGFSLCFENY